MKKLTSIFAILLMAVVPFIISCGTDEEGTPPSLMFNASPGFTTADATVPANTQLKIGIIASSTSAKLTNIKIIQTVNGSETTVHDSTFNSDKYSSDFNFKAASQVGTVKLTFKITAADGESAEISLSITTTAGLITTYSQKILGSYESATGSSFASVDGSVYSLADAKTNAAKVDWMYFYGGATNLATFVAPNHADAVSVFPTAASWSIRNNTKLTVVTLPSGITWDGITNDATIVTLAAGLTATKANQLAVGNIVAFKTDAGKMGLIKIEAISGTTAGSITYAVKVQK